MFVTNYLNCIAGTGLKLFPNELINNKLSTQHMKLLLFILLTTLVFAGCSTQNNITFQSNNGSPTENVGEIPFTTLMKGECGAHDEAKDYVITNMSAWEDLFVQTDCLVPVENISKKDWTPEVDFSKKLLIAVYGGRHGTSGYPIEVIKIIASQQSYTVYVREKTPGKYANQIGTYPYHVVTIDKTNLPIFFIHS